MNVVMYGTHCSQCNVMEAKLKKANIPYTYIDDEKTVVEFGKSNGINMMPIVVVDGKVMNYSEALKWVKEIA